MLSSTLNLQNISQLSHRINKVTSSILATPIKGYSGACPFLRGLSHLSNYTSPVEHSSAAQGEAHSLVEQVVAEAPAPQASEPQESCAFNYLAEQQEQQFQAPNTTSNQAASRSRDHSTDETNVEKSQGKDQDQQQQQQQQQQTIEASKQQHPAKQTTKDQIYDYESKLKQLIQSKKDDNSYRVFRKVKRFSNNFPYGTEQDKPVTIWCSNDYFGMSTHPKVKEAIIEALHKYGAGSGGTRNIAGNSPLHEQLEWELADLHEKEAALLFSSCYVANDSTLYTLLKLFPNCHILSDEGNHASMIQGIRNSGAKRTIFKNFDAKDLEEKLKLLPLEVPKIVAFETVHSMSGDISDVELLCDISHKYGALTFVDEVHAVGLYGQRGAGIAQRENCMNKIDIISGTLGKAYGNCGGYIAGSRDLIDVVRSYAAGFIFTTSLPPTVACGATESVRILKSLEGQYLRELQQNNVFHMKKALTAAGLPHYHSKSHIIPIPIGNSSKCTQVSSDLLDMGHYIQSINYPTVPKGTERLRVSISPYHSEQMIDNLVEILVSVWRTNNLDFLPPVEMIGQCRRHQILSGLKNTKVGHSLWCEVCHKEMELCKKTAAI